MAVWLTITLMSTGFVVEELVQCGDGLHYHLDFTFGPSGCYFSPKLRLELEKKYYTTGCHLWLYDENGEELDGERYDSNNEVKFYIPHFSRYAYDNYYY